MSSLQQPNLRFGFITGLLLCVFPAFSQEFKYGHTNLGNLLELLPETKQAEAALKTYADSLSKVAAEKEEAFMKLYASIQEKYNKGELTPLQTQEAQNDLAKKQQELQAFEKNAQDMGARRRDELLDPILDKILAAIQAVAKEGGYSLIFDTSSGAMLHADEKDDVTQLVRKQLGL